MRSLTLTRAQTAAVCGFSISKAGAVAVDPESGTLYVAVERKGDMGLEGEVVSLTPAEDGGFNRAVS